MLICHKKINFFGWKAVHDGIAAKENSYKRRCEVEHRCPMCGEGFETTLHTLVMCNEACLLCKLSPFRLEIKNDEAHTFMEWCSKLTSIFKDKQWWDLFWFTLWVCGYVEMLGFFESKRIQVEYVLRKASSSMLKFGEANENSEDKPLDASPIVKHWKPPDMGLYKINVHAAVFEGGKDGFGGVFHDGEGDVMGSTCMIVEGCFSVDVVEAMATHHTLKVEMEAGLRQVVLESSDCLKLVDHLNNTNENSYLGNILNDISVMSRECF